MRCPNCNSTLVVGQPAQAGASAAEPGGTVPGGGVFDRDKFLLRQQHLAINEKYYVNDEQGNAILYVERPAQLLRTLLAVGAAVAAVVVLWIVVIALGSLAGADAGAFVGLFALIATPLLLIGVMVALVPLRHVGFYTDDSMREKLLEVRQDSRWQIPTATYTLRDAAGGMLAKFKKNFLHDIFRKRWVCETPDGRELFQVKEDSIILSMLRRFLGPLFGVLRTNFVFLRGERVLGEFNRKFTLLDRYVLDLSQDRPRSLDRRIALAIGVMLDTGERR
jgi:uncharacterized protein YxjI